MANTADSVTVRQSARADTAAVNALVNPLLVGGAATALTVAQFAPQAWRVRRHGSAGVSTATWMLTAVATTGWLAWGVAENAGATIATNAICGPLAWLVVITITKSRRDATTTAAVAAATAATGFFAPGLTGAALATIGPVSNLPQVWRAWKADDLTGLSISAWASAVAAQLLWVWWAILEQHPAVWAGAGVSTVQAAAVCAVAIWKRQRNVPAHSHATP